MNKIEVIEELKVMQSILEDDPDFFIVTGEAASILIDNKEIENKTIDLLISSEFYNYLKKDDEIIETYTADKRLCIVFRYFHYVKYGEIRVFGKDNFDKLESIEIDGFRVLSGLDSPDKFKLMKID